MMAATSTNTLERPMAGDANGGAVNPRSRGGKSVETLVVIGNGPVSYKFCEALAGRGGARRYNVVVFGEEKRPAYNRVLLTQCFDKRAADDLLMASREWYEENQITLLTGDPIVSIDREARLVQAKSGREQNYDKLVFATGSRAFVPSIPGTDLPGVFVYRTTDDISAIQNHAPVCRRAAVLGGGLLGLEAAHALKQLGLETWVVERGSSLLARQLEPEGSALLETHAKSLGLHVCNGYEVERIEAVGLDRWLHFRNGERLRVQMVILAVGIRPRTELANACGLAVHPKGGVVVDDFLQTSDARIFAIGECASHRGRFYGLAAPGYEMAAGLAGNLTGRRRKFQGCEPSTWLKLPGISVATLGDFQGGSAHLVARGEGTFRRIALHKNRLVGATAVGEWPEQSRVQERLDRRGRVWRWERARFAKTGRLWRGAVPLPVARWAAHAIVCNCMGVRRQALSDACARGCATADALARATGASTVCGSCRPLLEQLTGSAAPATRILGTRALLVAAILGLIVGGVIAVAPPIPFAESVRQKLSFDLISNHRLFRQISGFTLVGLVLIGSLLSLRKRLPRFRWGSVGLWRAVHAALGTLALAALVTHTGFRFGHSLNFVLMTNFVALALLGALAGGVTALEARLPGPSARQLRAFWTGAHIALVWPLPVLVLFHVLVSYRF
jgi:nitrite reductase (NADH) large subunit